MKLFLKIFLSIVVVIVLIIGIGMFYLMNGLSKGNKLAINPVTVSSLKDGTYNGAYKAGRWSNEVAVTIKSHKIAKIDIIKDVTFAIPEVSQKVFNKVVAKQNTDVDVVSGATVTSKAYLKSIENALK